MRPRLARITTLFAFVFIAARLAIAQAPLPTEKADLEMVLKIKAEGTLRSQVMDTASYLTDVNGPRLTNSPQIRRASEWARGRLAEWGLENSHLESWGPFGRGWSLEGFTANMTDPQFTPLIAYPKAWSSSTPEVIRGAPVYLDAKNDAELEQFKGKLKGAIVLIAPPRDVKAHFESQGTRQTEQQLLDLSNAGPGASGRYGAPRQQPNPQAQAGQPGAPAAATAGQPVQPPAAQQGQPPTGPQGQGRMTAEQLAALQMTTKKWRLCYEEGAAVVLEPGRGDGGTIFVQQATLPPPPAPTGQAQAGGAAAIARQSPWAKDAPAAIPQIVVAAEHYNRIVRMLQRGAAVKLELAVKAAFHDDNLMSANIVAEIPGTDPSLKDEVVMLGAHFDSWHSGTGATDNAAGSAVCMEAIRILKAIDAKPRRTIRVALWTGEEEGLLGSRAYVTDHFGRRIDPQRQAPQRGPDAAGAGTGGAGNDAGAGTTASNAADAQRPGQQPAARYELKPEHDKLAAYFNYDNGTGKIRGVHMQGNEAVRPIFRAWLAPFKDMGASTLSLSNTGGTDHLSFDAVGLPGFQFIQDEIEYDSRTHHSNMDVWDRLQEDDLKQSAIIMASFVYHAAQRDEKLPRKPLAGERISPPTP